MISFETGYQISLLITPLHTEKSEQYLKIFFLSFIHVMIKKHF